MAEVIKAIQAYSPKVKVDRIVEMKELVKYIGGRTGLNSGVIRHVLSELHDSLLHFTMTGCSVRLEEIGVFTPGMDNKGKFGMNFRVDKGLTARMNTSSEFHGTIRNKDMIGKTREEFIARWNEEHPEDRIEE